MNIKNLNTPQHLTILAGFSLLFFGLLSYAAMEASASLKPASALQIQQALEKCDISRKIIQQKYFLSDKKQAKKPILVFTVETVQKACSDETLAKKLLPPTPLEISQAAAQCASSRKYLELISDSGEDIQSNHLKNAQDICSNTADSETKQFLQNYEDWSKQQQEMKNIFSY